MIQATVWASGDFVLAMMAMIAALQWNVYAENISNFTYCNFIESSLPQKVAETPGFLAGQVTAC